MKKTDAQKERSHFPKSADITLIVDRSGSMEPLRKDTIGGLNTFMKEQRKIKGGCLVTIHQFDHEFDTLVEAKKIEQVESFTVMDFVPRGNTALCDAVVRGVNAALKRNEARATKAGHRIIVILTDGQENCSKESTNADVKAVIEKAQKAKFEVIFLAANQDAFLAAATMGVPRSHAMTMTANGQGVGMAYRSFSKNIGDLRKGMKISACFVAEDYDAQAKAASAPQGEVK